MRTFQRTIFAAVALAFLTLPLAAQAEEGGQSPAELALFPGVQINTSGPDAATRLVPIRIPDLPVELRGGLGFAAGEETGNGDSRWTAVLQGLFTAENYSLDSTLSLDRAKGESSLALGYRPLNSGLTLGALYLDSRPAADEAETAATGLPIFLLPKSGAELFGSGGEGLSMQKLAIFGDYQMNGKVGIHWGLGYASVHNDKAGYGAGAWQYNVGVGYKVLDHLLYEAHFGYLDTDESSTATVAEQATSIQDVYVISNNITMTF